MVKKEDQSGQQSAGIRNRSFFCIIILTAAMTYFLILALLFLAGVIYSGNIISMISSYYGSQDHLSVFFHLFISIGAILYFLSATGILLFMLNRKMGFYLFFAAALIIFSLDLSFLTFDWLRYLIHTGFIFILGIAHFSKRCYSIA
jgi:hypothetical protein